MGVIHTKQDELTSELVTKCMLLNVGIEKYNGQRTHWVMWNSYSGHQGKHHWKLWCHSNGTVMYADDPEELLRAYINGDGMWD